MQDVVDFSNKYLEEKEEEEKKKRIYKQATYKRPFALAGELQPARAAVEGSRTGIEVECYGFKDEGSCFHLEVLDMDSGRRPA